MAPEDVKNSRHEHLGRGEVFRQVADLAVDVIDLRHPAASDDHDDSSCGGPAGEIRTPNRACNGLPQSTTAMMSPS